jgi:hypothetical protein
MTYGYLSRLPVFAKTQKTQPMNQLIIQKQGVGSQEENKVNSYELRAKIRGDR